MPRRISNEEFIKALKIIEILGPVIIAHIEDIEETNLGKHLRLLVIQKQVFKLVELIEKEDLI
jgi:hypothetical protein